MTTANLHPQYIVDETNHRRSVVLPIEEYEALMEAIEDLAAVAERQEDETVSHEQLLAELQKDGLL